MAVRLFVLQAQYRKPIDFTDEAVFSANNGWNTLKEGTFGYQYGSWLGWKRSRGAEDLRAPSDPHLSSPTPRSCGALSSGSG